MSLTYDKNLNRAVKDNTMEQLIKLYQSGNLTEANKRADALLRENPDSFQLYNITGTIQATQGQLNEALISYQQAIKLKPDFTEAYFKKSCSRIRYITIISYLITSSKNF